MTDIKRNAGGDIALDLKFYGPPGANNALGDPFDLTGWEVKLINTSAQLKNKETITVTDTVQGHVRLSLEGTSAIPSGSQSFRIQLVRDSGPTAGGFSVGFPVTNILIGNYNIGTFDGEPPYQQLSGKNGVQVTIEPAEPEIIFGAAPVSNEVTNGGEVVTNNSEPVTLAA